MRRIANASTPSVALSDFPRSKHIEESCRWSCGRIHSNRAGAGAWVFTGDTAPNPALWQRLQSLRVAHLVIETAFRDDEHQLAHVSRHLHPAALGRELQQFAHGSEVHITHIKPGELDAVMGEIGALDHRHRVQALVAGQVLLLG